MNRSQPIPTRAVLWSAVLALAVGCGTKESPNLPVAGKVILKDLPAHQQRLEGARIRFQSTSDPNVEAVGILDHDGSFSLGTYSADQAESGLPPGEYRARVELPTKDDSRLLRGLVPLKYGDYRTSGLIFSVPVTGEIVIEVDRSRR